MFFYFETSYLLIVAFLMAIAIVVIYRWIIHDESPWIKPFACGFVFPLTLWAGTPWWGNVITSRPWIFYGLDLYDISEPVFWTSVVGVVYIKWIYPIVSIVIAERKK